MYRLIIDPSVLHRFKPVCSNIFLDFFWIKDLTVHSQIHTIRQYLHRSKCKPNIEFCIGRFEPSRHQCTNQNHRLVSDGLEMSGGRDHGISAVRDQYAPLRSLAYPVTNAVPVLFSQFHAVFCQECFDDIGDGDTNMLKNFCDLGISYPIITLGVEVHFVNCATSGEDKNFGRHYHTQCKNKSPYTFNGEEFNF